jgi:hypothetical protein
MLNAEVSVCGIAGISFLSVVVFPKKKREKTNMAPMQAKIILLFNILSWDILLGGKGKRFLLLG